MRRRGVLRAAAAGLLLAGTAVLFSCSREAERDARRFASAEIQRALAGRAPAYITAHHDGPAIWKALRHFYAARRYSPAWIDGTRPRPELDALLRAIDGAERHGLDPELYDLGPLSDARARVRTRFLRPSGFEPIMVAPMDIQLTAAWLAYASDLSNGVTARPHGDPMWRIRPRRVDLLPALQKAVDGGHVEGTLNDLAPQHDDYKRLAEARERYRTLVAKGGWPMLPARLALKVNERSPHLGALARRLAVTGDLPPQIAANPPRTYDSRLQTAVRRFRARHGFADSPALTRAVVAAMNVPIAARIRQIELNMERWRWFPRELGERHIRVNVPEYHLEVREGGRPVLDMKVIAGAIEKPTPIFSDTLTTVVFAPYWNVPSSIAKEETIPAVMSDPEFLVRNNIEILSTSGEVIDPGTIDWSATVADSGLDPNTAEDDDGLFEAFPYRFRQRPGTANSLGLVKFLFPNAFDVYLHDTPATALFAKSYRALSHGCIRLEQPVKLAEYLLENHKTWNSSRIREAMDGGEEQAVALPHPIPVHLMYWTARVDDEGRVLFLDDIYGHDSRQWQEYESRISKVKARKDRLRAAGLSGPVAGTSGAAPERAAGGGSLPRRVPPAGTASR